MNSSATWRLFIAAVALFVFIFFFERKVPDPSASAKPRIFGRLDARSVTSIDVRMTNLMLRAERTNDVWRLTTPFYPAQTTPIETFVATLTALPKLEAINPSEVAAGKLKDFGLDPPVASLTLNQGSNRYFLHLGGRLPLVDQVYAQVPGSGEVMVTDAAILKALPASANDWRSPMLLNLAGRPYDHVQIRAGPRQLEFERDVTNQIWRISKPTPARANNDRITQLLQQLATARVKEFVTDSPMADLERFGLQTPQLELTFALDTNRVTALEFGASPTNDPASVYVRRVATTNVVLVAREFLDALSQPYKTFHDPRLVSLNPGQITQLQVATTNSAFNMVRLTNGLWRVTEPAPMGVDPDLAKIFLTNLIRMEIVDFAKDVPTDADLKQFGLAPPQFSIAISGARTNGAGAVTNALLMQLDFGFNKAEDSLYARRSDETPVYVTPLGDLFLLPRFGWQLRDLRLFDFAPTNVAALIVTAGGITNRVARQPQGWTADPIQNAAIDEAVFRLGQLRARSWIGKGVARMPSFGFSGASPMLEAQVTKDGAPVPAMILFGKHGIRNNIYAATALPGETEPTLFEFPGDLYDLLVRAGLLPAR